MSTPALHRLFLGRTIVDFFPHNEVYHCIQGVIQLDDGETYLFDFRSAEKKEQEQQRELPSEWFMPLEEFMQQHALNQSISKVTYSQGHIFLELQEGAKLRLAEKED